MHCPNELAVTQNLVDPQCAVNAINAVTFTVADAVEYNSLNSLIA